MKRTSIPFLLIAFGAPVAAQEPQVAAPVPPGPEHVARVIAVVGDSAITNFDLDERLLAWRATTNQELPQPGTPEFERVVQSVLQDRINELVLVQAAERDTTLIVTDEEVASSIDTYLNQLRAQYGGDQGLTEVLQQQGRTLASFRETLQSQRRRDLLIQKYLAQVRRDRKPPPVTDAEVREFFETRSGEAGTRPALIHFEQVVVPTQPSDSALTRARQLADSLVHALRFENADFAQLARRFSADTASGQLGGDLGWFRQEQMVTGFSRVAFSPLLRPGDVTDPVLTPFGYHIIRLERIRGPERQARHILIRPTLTEEDEQRARALAEQLAGRIRGGENVPDLAREFGDPEEDVRLGPLQRDSLPGPYGEHLAGANEGDVVGPILLEGPGGQSKWAVVRITRTEEAREATFEDYREQIRQTLAQQKLVEEILQELRRRTYIDIRLAGGASTDR